MDSKGDIMDSFVMPKPSPQRKPKVGLRAIADDLGLSISFVSKVLSGRLGTSGVNAERARQIHAKARELNYRKNMLAEALRTGRQNVFAVMIHRHGGPGSAIVDEMLGGVSEAAAAIGQRLLIHYYEDRKGFQEFLPLIHQNSADGLIVAGIPHQDNVDDLAELDQLGIPIVTLHDQEFSPRFANVGMDQAKVSWMATKHLIDRGCRQIAHFRVQNPSAGLPVFRFEGYRQALKEHGLEINPKRIIPVPDFAYEGGEKAIVELMASGVPFDAIVCQSDQQAIAAINHLINTDLRVPQHVKVIGVDNAPFCRFAVVPLTSVSQQFRERGRQSVQMLAGLLNGQPASSCQVDPVVWERASTAVSVEAVSNPSSAQRRPSPIR